MGTVVDTGVDSGVDTPVSSAPSDGVVRTPEGEAAFVITRTTRGWAVLTPAGAEQAADLVEAMSLADLIAEDLGASPEPGRDARRAARGGAPAEAAADTSADPRDQQVADLQRTVAQLEHALATRVSTERAIGVLAAQRGTTPRAAFEQLRRDARSSGRPVHDLAREVLDGLVACAAPAAPASTAAPGAGVPTPAPVPTVESVPQCGPARPADQGSRRRVERPRRGTVLAEGEH